MRDRRFLTSSQICARYGDIDRTTLWRWRKTGVFPKPTKTINGVHYWDDDEIDAWDAATDHSTTRADAA